MKRVAQTLAVLATLAALGAAAVVGFGLYNVSARQGHLSGVGWALHTTFIQSVRLRAPEPSKIPQDLVDTDRIALGGLHFQSACAFCHAVPGQPRSATAMAMEPRPPHIKDAVASWEPQHLHWIVYEGVKMSGMPHWPAKAREDEVWSVVAYLEAVKAETSPTLPEATCAACHGTGGRSDNTHVPRLDILTPEQIAQALFHYRNGSRGSGYMQMIASQMSDRQIATLAQEFGTARLAAHPVDDNTTPGWLLANRGTDDVPSCTSCHHPKADAIAPAIAGQSQEYLKSQLYLWREGTRGGGKRAKLMRKAAQDLTDAQIAILADWYAAQRPPTPDP